ncbi:MAG: hypothetical protein DRP06_02615 [Candidatus Aenigmatarchaeota archaeon]|nr:MAG: hypothetical protein DRP06_02615 [Candidatus Aenigmarchaeota archaeon]
MVFVIKFRKNLLTDKIFEFIKIICKGIEKRYYLNFDALGFDDNPLHIVVEGAPRHSFLSETMHRFSEKNDCIHHPE